MMTRHPVKCLGVTVVEPDGTTTVYPVEESRPPTAADVLCEAGNVLRVAEGHESFGAWIEAEEALLIAFGGMAGVAGADLEQASVFIRKWSAIHHRFCAYLKSKGIPETA